MARTLRSKSIAVRREHILGAAIRVFSERGFHRSTIRDVAKAAGVSDGTIYNAFENKEALLLAILDPLGNAQSQGAFLPSQDIGSFLRTLCAERWSAFTPDALAMLRVVLSQVLVDPKLRSRFKKRFIQPTFDGMEPTLKSLAEKGSISGHDVSITTRLITASFLGLVLMRLLGDEVLEQRTTDVPAALATLLLQGLGSESNDKSAA